jgi:RNA polymerase sigma factor (sigma-70 family)
MATSETRRGWRALESLFDAGALGNLSDGELLECFQSSRETLGHEAFRVLVERHGPMVLGLCRSLVRDPHEADDAFQATFLVLVRKAESIKRRDTIGPWLHGVAGRVARRARDRTVRRQRREVEANEQIPCPVELVADTPAVEAIIHDEIARLSEAFRAPLVLCCLEGLSYDQAANRLGLTEPTLRGRLHRARKQLASRLRGHGITAGAVASPAQPFRLTLPPVPSSLVESTVQFSVRWSSVTGLLSGAATIPDSIAGLAQGVIRNMALQSIKLTGIGVVLMAGALGTVVVAQPRGNSDGGGAQATGGAVAKAQAKPEVDSDRERARLKELEGANKKLEGANKELHDQFLALKNMQVEKQLDLLVDVTFPDGISLVQLLKYVKQETTKAMPPGIPIYVNPLGLGEVQKNMEFMVKVDTKRTPVRVILKEGLSAAGLAFEVRDGFLMIDSRTGILERRVEEIDRKLDRVLQALDRLEKAK